MDAQKTNLLGFLAVDHLVMLGVPLAFYFCGGLGRILIRKGGGFWDRRDWYLAADASLANVAGGLLFIGELLIEGAKSNYPAAVAVKTLPGVIFVAVSLCLYMAILAAHQKIEHDPAKGIAQMTVLVLGCNIVSIGAMCGFIVFVKGI